MFDIDSQNCLNCGAEKLKIIASILERPLVAKIVINLGLDPQPQPMAPTRERERQQAS